MQVPRGYAETCVIVAIYSTNQKEYTGLRQVS